MSYRKINLGCGTDIREGYENYDMYPIDDRVKKIDLNCLPLPFENDSIDFVLLSHVLEHLDVNLFDFMKDIHRILKPPEGRVSVYLPSYCNIIQHTKMSFSHNYMDTLFKGTGEREQIEPLFNCVGYVRKRRWLDIIGQIKNRVVDLFSSEYIWVLEKK